MLIINSIDQCNWSAVSVQIEFLLHSSLSVSPAQLLADLEKSYWGGRRILSSSPVLKECTIISKTTTVICINYKDSGQTWLSGALCEFVVFLELGFMACALSLSPTPHPPMWIKSHSNSPVLKERNLKSHNFKAISAIIINCFMFISFSWH